LIGIISFVPQGNSLISFPTVLSPFKIDPSYLYDFYMFWLFATMSVSVRTFFVVDISNI
jgi:hypothetical protein